jgi:DNA-binding IclR family transcriptional regulator
VAETTGRDGGDGASRSGGDGPSSPSRTLEKGLQVLSLFDVDRPEWAFKEIREATGLPKATGFRLVKTLENLKYLARNPQTGKYHLGSAMMKAAYLTLSHSNLVRLASPYVEELAKRTTETIDVAVWTDQGSVIVHTEYTLRPFRPHSPPGMVLGGLTNVHSKIFVAFGPRDRWDAAIAENVGRTPHSIVDPVELREELERVLRLGVAFGVEEHNLGTCAVGAPVFDSAGEVRATMAVVTPSERFDPEVRRGHAAAVRETALRLSGELGYVGGRTEAQGPHTE